ncbi:MAG: hypothetical protein GY862_24465 [Gammaproteobacteria bacterium]|nr:hypothetical protein [Gammaproteobacteria bacterium]
MISACSVPTARKTKPKQDPVRQAKYLASKGDYAGAAREYLRLADQVSSPADQAYRMSAVEYLLKVSRLSEAKSLLTAVRPAPQEQLLQARAQLAYAQIDIAEQRAEQALIRLDKLRNISGLSPLFRRSYHYVRALALETLDKHMQAAAERVLLDPLLTDAFSAGTNHQALWDDLIALTPSRLNQAPQMPPGREHDLRGWLALALLVKTTPPGRYSQALTKWRGNYPSHPAERDIVTELNSGVSPGLQEGYVPHIALLLPMTGKFKHSTEAIRDGFITAWYAAGSTLGTRIYDTHERDIEQIYQQAVDEGAQWVVGPLDKTALKTLIAAYASFPVPTLALNAIENQDREFILNLYQFSLSPEEEARAIAERARVDGYYLAGAIVPEGSWGERVFNAFAARWQALGGSVVASGFYRKDFATPIKALAKEYKQRKIDMVLVLAFPRQARQIRPQFRYFRASNLPLYATSHVYGGRPNPKTDHDLDDIRFPIMPWGLTPGEENASAPLYAALLRNWRDGMIGAKKRLYAFGVDTFRLISALRESSTSGTTVLPAGVTGRLSLDAHGVIHRELLWARFVKGIAELIDAPPPAAENPAR